MIVMMCFLILSICIIIFTIFYLSYKKNNNNINKNQYNNDDNFNNSENKKDKKRLEEILKIKIKDNVISLGNRYSAIIKLGNIDYNMLSNNEQNAVENILIQTALTIDYPIQFFSTTEYIDTTKVINLIKENKSNKSNIQTYQSYLIEYLENLMENRSISVVKNYAIISSDGTFENAIEELNRKTMSFKSNMLSAKIVCEILNEEQIYNLIYRELNKNSVLNVSTLLKGEKNLYVGKKQKANKSI